mmetsp:Transcript_84890/g.235406  ORF Transcript_84890/g.235406 Transcript_84890/m.235406 type:complete len:279 (-) Transcript_84890:523-1359(-)
MKHTRPIWGLDASSFATSSTECWLQLEQISAPQCRQWWRRTQVPNWTPHFMHCSDSQSGTQLSWPACVTCSRCSSSRLMLRTRSMSRAAALASLSNWGRPLEASRASRKSCCSTRSEPSGRWIRTRTGSTAFESTTVCTSSSLLNSSSTASKMGTPPTLRLQCKTTSLARSRARSSAGSSAEPRVLARRTRRTTSVARSSTEGHRSTRASRITSSRVRSFCACSSLRLRSPSVWSESAALLDCSQCRTQSIGMTIVSLTTFLMAWMYSSSFVAECKLS